jgi:hypothetical protein
MPDRRNKWDECHRIYPKIGEILDCANETRKEPGRARLTFLLRQRSQARETLLRRGALSDPSSMERGLLARAIRHVEEIKGPAVLSQIPSASRK